MSSLKGSEFFARPVPCCVSTRTLSPRPHQETSSFVRFLPPRFCATITSLRVSNQTKGPPTVSFSVCSPPRSRTNSSKPHLPLYARRCRRRDGQRFPASSRPPRMEPHGVGRHNRASAALIPRSLQLGGLSRSLAGVQCAALHVA